VVPIAPVTSQARGVKTEHRADLSGTQVGHQSIKAWPGHSTACRAAQILVNDFDLRKSVVTGFLHQFVLPALTLQVHDHL
jgi:hypothetical protein